MKIKLLLFLGVALAGIHNLSAADTLAIGEWGVPLDEMIGKHKAYTTIREVRIEALKQK